MEGPYYIRMRYALYHFAEAIERAQPSVGIYKYRNSILKKALYSAVETSFPTASSPINDASRTMAIDAPGKRFWISRTRATAPIRTCWAPRQSRTR